MFKVTAKFPNKKVLIVDDYEVNQELTREFLEMMDIEVDIAGDGNEALEKISSNQYDAVLMDIQMPGLDGFAVTKEVRKENKDLIIIALTANALQGDEEKCLKSGMNDYLAKPIRGHLLQDTLSKYF